MAADSPPSDRTQAGRIWPKLLASHWASTPSNESVYPIHCCAKSEFVIKNQGTAGYCGCNQRPSLSWLEH